MKAAFVETWNEGDGAGSYRVVDGGGSEAGVEPERDSDVQELAGMQAWAKARKIADQRNRGGATRERALTETIR